MNVKLVSGLAGDRFSFRPLQTIKCSDRAGARLIAEGIAKEASEDAETDGELFDKGPEPEAPVRRRQPERADAPAPESPEIQETAALCRGKTSLGNACKKAPVPGSKFCAKHEK